MDPNDIAGIRFVLQNKFGFRVVTHPTVVLVSSIIEEPGSSAGKLQRRLTAKHGFSASSIFKTYKKLKEYEVVDSKGNLTFTTADMRPKIDGERMSVPLVGFIRERTLTEDQYIWVHIAAWIAEQSNNIELCQQVKNSITNLGELVPWLKEMQNGLAFCAIMAGDITNWIDMKGETTLNEDAIEILRKAGIKI